MQIISFGNPGGKPTAPRWAHVLVATLEFVFMHGKLLLVGAVLLIAAAAAWGGTTVIGPARICFDLNLGEACRWTVVRTLSFRFIVVANDTGGSAWVLSRGRTIIGSGPLPAEFGPVTEDNLLRGSLLLPAIRFARGDEAMRARILSIAGLSSGVPYLDEIYATRTGDGTGDSLGSVLTGKLRIAVAQ